MAQLNILCVDDQREVLATLRRDLDYFVDAFNLVECESVDEARQVMNELVQHGELIPLIICDHIMPGTTGIDFLIELNNEPEYEAVLKLLLTGLATHEDTIRAINQAHIDHYIQKPWTTQNLQDAVKRLLTDWVVRSGMDFRQYLPYLDKQRLFTLMQERV